jgi:predicted amino acid-binding ACT domain protein
VEGIVSSMIFNLLSQFTVNIQPLEHLGVVAAVCFVFGGVQFQILDQKLNILGNVVEFLILTDGGIKP